MQAQGLFAQNRYCSPADTGLHYATMNATGLLLQRTEMFLEALAIPLCNFRSANEEALSSAEVCYIMVVFLGNLAWQKIKLYGERFTLKEASSAVPEECY